MEVKYMNRPVDWKAFEYKFSTDSRPAFESLAYILFCYEFKQTYGIFRYYNQPYIETQPANTDDGHKVGFQAKYYDAGTQMSSKEQDLKDAIKGAKNKYAGIDRIIFYINAKFYKMAAIRIGYHPATLYSITYVLNSIGKDIFSKEGLEWLSIIIKNNPHLEKAALPANTQYYMEEYMNSLIKKEKFTLRTDNRRRKQAITVLNFLVSKGSTPGFRMRDEII